MTVHAGVLIFVSKAASSFVVFMEPADGQTSEKPQMVRQPLSPVNRILPSRGLRCFSGAART